MELALLAARIFIPFLIIFNLIPIVIWAERKGAAYIQDRRGPNRASILGLRLGGLLHSLSDVIKLLFKEDVIPLNVDRFFYVLAPWLTLTLACVTFAVIPFADSLNVAGRLIPAQAATLNAGILYIFALASLGVYGVMLAGWSSNNKYALLGGLRSSAQMISYEIAMSLAVVSIIMMAGSLELGDIIQDQGANPWHWNLFRQPLAVFIFITAAFAETNRNPFDLPEGESELVAGYHVEYSSMKFAMFFMAEYANIMIASALMACLFLGGWQVPFLATAVLRAHSGLVAQISLMGLGIFHGLLGLYFMKKFKKGRYGDLRDYEMLILGVPALVVGVALIVLALTVAAGPHGELLSQLIVLALQVATFLVKLIFFVWFFIWVRWTLPRFRYDQLMHLGWKVMLPLALANIVVTAVAMIL